MGAPSETFAPGTLEIKAGRSRECDTGPRGLRDSDPLWGTGSCQMPVLHTCSVNRENPMAQELTARQQQVLETVGREVDRLGVAPTLAELAAIFNVQPAAVRDCLKALERKGHLIVIPGLARGI